MPGQTGRPSWGRAHPGDRGLPPPSRLL